MNAYNSIQLLVATLFAVPCIAYANGGKNGGDVVRNISAINATHTPEVEIVSVTSTISQPVDANTGGSATIFFAFNPLNSANRGKQGGFEVPVAPIFKEGNRSDTDDTGKKGGFKHNIGTNVIANRGKCDVKYTAGFGDMGTRTAITCQSPIIVDKGNDGVATQASAVVVSTGAASIDSAESWRPSPISLKGSLLPANK